MLNIGTKLKVLVETVISYLDGRKLTLECGDTFIIPDDGHLMFFQQQLIFNPILFYKTFEVVINSDKQNAPNPHIGVGNRLPYLYGNSNSECGRSK